VKTLKEWEKSEEPLLGKEEILRQLEE